MDINEESPYAQGVIKIADERLEHLTKHKFDLDHDKTNNKGELANVAVAIITGDNTHFPKWWGTEFLVKAAGKSRIEKLTIAGSLIAAEIDRLLYEEQLNQKQDETVL